MDELQRILKVWLRFFFVGGRYQVVNTQTGPSPGDALVDFSSARIIWRLANDRSQPLLSCCPGLGKYNDVESYSIDLLVRLIDGEKMGSAILTKEKSEWIEANLLAIEDLFTAEKMAQTISDMKKLKKLRAKELFG